MTDPAKPCTRCRLWNWWTGERTPRHRLVAYMFVALVFVGGMWRVETTANTTQDLVAQIQDDRQRRIVESTGRDFAQCEGVNVAIGKLDQVLMLAGQLGSDERTPAEQARVEDNFRLLRQGLELRDCSVYLRDLSPTQRDTVTATTVPPTLPRSHP